MFVDGVHDNLNLLKEYETSEWNGGKVKTISGKLRYLCRGEVFTVEDQTIFAFGGGENLEALEASSQHYSAQWWDLQLPSPEQIENAKENLKKVNNTIDYIVTHQCSRQAKQLLTMEDDEANVLDTFFNEVRSECDYKGWFFGNYHLDKVLPPKEMAVFQRVIPLKDSFRESLAG